jgi:hypothetical protein
LPLLSLHSLFYQVPNLHFTQNKYGKAFQGIEQAWTGQSQAIAKIEVSQYLVDLDADYHNHVSCVFLFFTKQSFVVEGPSQSWTVAQNPPFSIAPPGLILWKRFLVCDFRFSISLFAFRFSIFDFRFSIFDFRFSIFDFRFLLLQLRKIFYLAKIFHPAVLDAILHTSFIAIPFGQLNISHNGGGLYLPISADRVNLVLPPFPPTFFSFKKEVTKARADRYLHSYV